MQESTFLIVSKKYDYQTSNVPQGGVGRAWSKWSKPRSVFFVVTATVVVTSVLFAIGSNYLLRTANTYPLDNNFKYIGNIQGIAREAIDDILLSLEALASPSSDQGHKRKVSLPMMDMLSSISNTYISDSDKDSSSSTTTLVYLNQSNAYELLWRSAYREHYFAYQAGLDVQKNQAYCGAATVTAVLNSLRVTNATELSATDGVDFPNTGAYKPYPYATQSNIFNPCTQQAVVAVTNMEDHPCAMEGVADGILTFPYGLNLQQVATLLQCHLSVDRWNITAYHATSPKAHLPTATLDDEEPHAQQQMKSIMIEALRNSRSRLIINYHRLGLGQVGGGHFSPIGAYNEEKDLFLILDVSKYKYPPVWATFAQIYHAMSTIDSCGFWNYPDAQNKLPDHLKRGLPPLTEEHYQAALQRLGCKPTFRGFIVIDEI